MTPSGTATPTLTSWADDDAESQTPATTTTTRTTTVRAPAPRHEDTRPLGAALDALVGLEPNWDSYGALPPSRGALVHAWGVASMLVEQGLPIPQVFPTRNGGVQLEWHVPRASLEWEIDADLASGAFVFDDHLTGEQIDGELPADIEPLATALSRILVG
jgi:hypothetical protein